MVSAMRSAGPRVRKLRLRGEWETHIGVRDSLIYGLLRDEWMMDKQDE